jgi:hypothetical protein
MVAGTLVELVARGKQDIYLIGNPNFTYFKTVYHRHTNFSIEPVRNIFNEQPDFGKRVTCFIDKKGDLLNTLFLEIELPSLKSVSGLDGYSWVNSIGNFMIDYVEIQLGGEPIDRISGQLLDVWNELTVDPGVKNAYYKMIGKAYGGYTTKSAEDSMLLYVPLPFWFCRKISQSLPLIAMQYTDVSIVVQFRPFDYCWYKGRTGDENPTPRIYPTNSPTPHISAVNLYSDYVFLDTYERKKFAEKKSYEILIEQFQEFGGIRKTNGINNITTNFYFNHPVKELIWIYQSDYAQSINAHSDYLNYTNYESISTTESGDPIYSVQLKFNGNDRFEERYGSYFRYVQPYQRHSFGPSDCIYVWSFAINPEDLQPSGTCNFSKIDDAKIIFRFVNKSSSTPISGGFIIFATNYNILKIESGMAGVLFSS